MLLYRPVEPVWTTTFEQKVSNPRLLDRRVLYGLAINLAERVFEKHPGARVLGHIGLGSKIIERRTRM